MIYEQLRKFQKLGITIKRDSTNPHFKNTYSSLDEVLSKVKDPLLELGVLIVQEPTIEGLKTRLIDLEDSSEISGIMPWVGTDNAQKVLSCVTYYRRGSLVSMLGLEDSDDDGNTASTPKPITKTKGIVDRTDEPFPSRDTGGQGGGSERVVGIGGPGDISDIKWDAE